MSSTPDNKMSVLVPSAPSQNPFSQTLAASASSSASAPAVNPLEPQAESHDRRVSRHFITYSKVIMNLLKELFSELWTFRQRFSSRLLFSTCDPIRRGTVPLHYGPGSLNSHCLINFSFGVYYSSQSCS